MSTETADLAEELFVQVASDDPRCELSFVCDIHGDEDCGGRARWVMLLVHTCGISTQFLVCDECHDAIVEAPSRVPDKHQVEWRAL